MHDVRSIKDLVFVVGGNSESTAQKTIFELLDDRVRDSDHFRPEPEECKNCIRKGKRDCMYHGYPDTTIPKSCDYKIGDAAVDTVYDVPVMIRKQGGK